MDRRFFCRWYCKIFALVVAFLLLSNCAFAAERAGAPSGTIFDIFGPPKYMKHISAAQAQTHLAELVTGTVTIFPGGTALLVTAQPSELAKARVILELVDSPDQYVIKKILPISAARKMPMASSPPGLWPNRP